ncbi:MAG TPA: hypothetical protein VKS22_09260 [Candidatus Binataceae bacterium]|nr:hypothetical protein [Candidatus Binataceae bacterium]
MTVNEKIALSILAAVGILVLLTLIAAFLMIGMAWQDFERSAAERRGPAAARSGFGFVRLALARRCPVCGRGAISRSLFQMNQTCPRCSVTFWSNEGEWIGPAVINYSAALAGALAAWALLVMFDCSATAQIIVASLAAVGAGVMIVPWSRSFWTLFLYLSGEIRPHKVQ